MDKRVLIANGDRQARAVLGRHLAVWGYDVTDAANGAEAWRVLNRADAPRIVLIDAALPGLDALELCERVREVHGDEPLLLVLASNRKEALIDALESGADGVIESPVNARELKTHLAAALRGRRKARTSRPPSRGLPHELLGRVIAGKYRIERLIGNGGMGTVWEGTHLALGISVAVKFIKGDYARHSLARARFELEARAAARLRTKYAVKVFDYGMTEDGLSYLVMEYLEGPSLLQRATTEGPLSFAETATLVTQAAHALGEAHALGIIHRDVKPDNILLISDPDSVGPVAKLIDFGVVKVLDSQGLQVHGGYETPSMATGAGIVVGTPNFMAPEQLRNEAAPDAAADLWALAACAFTAITGRIPFEGATLGEVLKKVCHQPLPVPSEYNRDVPREFDAWFLRACHPDPTQRFATARELAIALSDAYESHADTSLDMTPSLTRFVAREFVAEQPSSSRLRIFELDEPMSATAC